MAGEAERMAARRLPGADRNAVAEDVGLVAPFAGAEAAPHLTAEQLGERWGVRKTTMANKSS